MHRARIRRVGYPNFGQVTPFYRWVFECHEVELNGHLSTVYVCGEGSYRSWARALKCLRQHALGKHDFIL